MTLEINKYKNIFIKYKWLAKSPEDQYIVELSAETDNIKDTYIRLKKVFKSKGTPKGKDQQAR